MAKYKIVRSFRYRGRDGEGKPDRASVIGPGEKCPPLNSDERTRLIREGKIAELSSQTGEIIPRKNTQKLSNDQITGLFKKSKSAVQHIINQGNLSSDTLARMSVYCERNNAPKDLKDAVDRKLER